MTSAALPRKIFVYQASPGKSCLRGVQSPRLRWFDDHDGRGGSHHITVLPASQDIDFTGRASEIPDWAWTPVRNGSGKVLIDACLEGWPHSRERTCALHDFLDRVGVPHDRAVYVTQDRGYAGAYEHFLRKKHRGPGMKVLTFDFWLREIARQYEDTGEEEFESRLAAYRARPRRRPFRFLSLNRTPRETRALFLLRLIRDGLWDQGAISVGGLDRLREEGDHSDDIVAWMMFRRHEFEDLNHELRPFVPRLAAIGEVVFRSGRTDLRFGDVLDEPLPQYAQSWFSVVTETEMKSWPCRITEKSLKPLLNFHPLLFFGNPGSLDMLRAYGFETFEGLFEQAYDKKHNPRRRFELAYREVQRLCAMDEAELDRLERGMDEVLIHNARHGLTALPRIFRTERDHQIVVDILAPADPASC